ncbi:MAG: hypothetical protein IKO52_05695 [Clostridia bacterium]|nr:hypothetical protein [Clostridia bacterium]
MKRFVSLALLLALLFPVLPAQAGWNPLTVAADGKGIAVYTSSSGGKQAGILYNGFNSGLDLEPTNGLYGCGLTAEYTVWLNQRKAEKNLPKGWDVGSVNSPALEAQMPCQIFLAEVSAQDAPLYSTPGHKHLNARHAPGALALVCGEFGDDYYVNFGSYALSGFMPKSALRKVQALTYAQANGELWGIETADIRTVYTGGGVIMRSGSATGYSDNCSYWQVRDGERVTVLATVGNWVQLVGGGFLEARFLDPDGDHSRTYAAVKSDRILDRLNVRAFAGKDAAVNSKLCAGAPVQVVNRTDDWAFVYITGETGGSFYSGAVQTQYLAFGAEAEQVKNGCTRVRTKYLLHAGNGGDQYRASWQGEETLPIGTELTVVGVEGHYDAEQDYPDKLICLTDGGRLITVYNDGVVEPVNSLGITAKTTSRVKMREAPGKTAIAAFTLSKGEKVEVLLRGEGWTMVRYKHQTGYVMSRYLQFP